MASTGVCSNGATSYAIVFASSEAEGSPATFTASYSGDGTFGPSQGQTYVSVQFPRELPATGDPSGYHHCSIKKTRWCPVQIFDPTAPPPAMNARPIHRPDTLEGRSVAFLDNGWSALAIIHHEFERLLTHEYGVAAYPTT